MCLPATNSESATMTASAADRIQSCPPVWLMAAMLVLMTIALYWPATRCGFVNLDDNQYVMDNTHVTSGLTLANTRWAFRTGYAFNWHPITWLSHMMDCQLFGLKPWGHHLTNVLLHAVNTALVFLLLCSLTGALWRSVLVAALFGLHPVHVESVAWVAERKDVLSTCFGLLALLFYARYAQGRLRVAPEINAKTQRRKDASRTQPWAGAGGRPPVELDPSSAERSATGILSGKAVPSVANYSLALFFFACGLMSKPMLVTWPFVMLLLDYWPLCRILPQPLNPQPATAQQLSTFWKLVMEKIPFFVLAVVTSVVTFEVQKHGGAIVASENLLLGARGGNALVSYCRYLGKLFWPTDLAVFYPHPGYWPTVEVLLAGGLILGISVLLIVEGRRYPFLLMGWLWYCGTLVPAIGLVQVGEQAMADRYTYVPSLGMLILATWAVYELIRRWQHHVNVSSVAGAAVIVVCMALTRQELGHWKDSEALFRHALEVTENNHIAYDCLGSALAMKGQVDEAIIQFQAALCQKPDDAKAHSNLGNALTMKGQIDEAITQFQEALHLNPNDAEAHNNLGYLWAERGENLEQAQEMLEQAVRLEPKNAAYLDSLGWVLFKLNHPREGLDYLLQAVENSSKPSAALYDHLGDAYATLNQREQAAEAWRQSLSVAPNPQIQKKLTDWSAH